MPTESFPRDSFDDVPADADRVGAHRAENPRMRGGVVFAWAAAATVVLIGVGIVGTLIVTDRLNPTPDTVPTTAAPSITPVVDTSYSVVILNATGQAGAATAVGDAVVHAGWPAAKVSPGEAGSTYPTTTVYYATPADAPAAEGLARVVGDAIIAQSDKYQPTGDSAAKQLTVVLGTDRVASASPAPTS